MIEELKLTNFKKFKDCTLSLKPDGISLLAGGNNSGKSSVLQALAVWDFCLTVLRNERGETALLSSSTGQGIGLSDDEFSPINVPSLGHLWTNLTNQVPGKDGYTLSIKPVWRDSTGTQKFIQISLALANDRLFIKQTASNLTPQDKTPAIAFVPPFAGISAKEPLMSVAQRRVLTGSGLVGGIIRNLLYELEKNNQEKRSNLKNPITGRIKNSDLRKLRETDPWEALQSAMGRYFQTGLTVSPFNELYHNYIRVTLIKGKWEKTRIKKFKKFKPRDLMVEGSGFLQWLSVFSLALDPETDVLLLDEPDAHLHATMQTMLVSELENAASLTKKQVLFATHSTEILRWAEHSKILQFSEKTAKYLAAEDGRVALFAGLGSDFSPRLDKLKKHKALLLVENESDARFLEVMANKIKSPLNKNLVIWPWTGSSKERKQLFLQLQKEIPDLQAISIRDRDDLEQNNVDPITLLDKSIKNAHPNLKLRVWQRRHIENYLLCIRAISSAAGKSLHEVKQVFIMHHALAVPDDTAIQNVPSSIKDARGKEIIETDKNSISKTFNITKFDIADHLDENEVADDIRIVISEINAML